MSIRAVVITAAVVAVLPHLVATMTHSVELARPSTTVLARRWIETHVPRGSRILINQSQVPQLSFTPESLQRRRETQGGAAQAQLGESRRTALNADVSAADRLRTKSLTEVGVPYNLFVILEPVEEPVPDRLDFYTHGFAWTASTHTIQYVVLSSFVYGTFLDDPDDYLRRYRSGYRNFVETLIPEPAVWTLRRTFYEDIESLCELIFDVRPSTGRTAGPHIKVYRVRNGLASGGAATRQ